MKEEQKPEEEKRNLTENDVDAIAKATSEKMWGGIAGGLLLIYILRDWQRIPTDLARQFAEVTAFFHHLFSN